MCRRRRYLPLVAVCLHQSSSLGAPPALPASPPQATQRLRRYRSLGPGFERLARELAGLLQALEEAEYELQELEQFRQLAAVTG